jgi:hypothetical protein
MNLGMKYIKTDNGRAEVTARTGALNVAQRRLLILIDGNRTVNDLGALVRVGDLEAALEHLQQLGLIATTEHIALLLVPLAPGFAAAAEGDRPRAATSPEEFKKIRQQALNYVSEQLGSAGEAICLAIDRCDSPAELRKLLRGIEIFVGQRLSTETAQAFARHFGSLLL